MNLYRMTAAFMLALTMIFPVDGAVITGVVTGPDGHTGLAGIEVTSWVQEGDVWYSDYFPSTTDSSGQYTIYGDGFSSIGLSQGVYRVEFRDPSGAYAMETYDDAISFWRGDDIVISSDSQTISGIDASLAAGSGISGKVTGPDGITPLANIQVTASVWDGSQWYWLDWVDTDSSGNYTIDGLPAGSYMVDFYDSSGVYVSETYDDSLFYLEGNTVVISSPGQSVTGIDASLATASSISGTITGPGGTPPLADIDVSAYIQDGSNWTWLGWAYTDVDGNYTISGLPSGNYLIEFYDLAELYAIEYYNDAQPWAADEIALAPDTALLGIDASLSAAAHISGHVTGPAGTTPLEYIEAAAYIWSGSDWVYLNWALTDSNGDYDVGALPPGVYQVDFYDYDGVYAYEVFNNAATVGLGTDIVLSAEQMVGNISASLNYVPPVVVGLGWAGGASFRVDFTGISGMQYILQESGSLLSGWSDVGAPIVCQPGTNQIPVSSDAGQAFWRVELVP